MTRKLLLLTGLLIGIGVVAFFWFRSTPRPPSTRVAAATPSSRATPHSVRPETAEPARPAAPDASQTPLSPVATLLAKIDRVLALLAASPDDPALDDLRRTLLGADPAQSIAAMLEFLRSGRDATTGQPFAVGERGALSGAPTMRVFLLDLLGQVSKTARTDAASTYSRTLLESKTSADEWAIAMRNIGWHDPAARTYLADKVRDMIHHQPWLAEPSGGFAEAFDVIVFTQDVTFTKDLAELLQSPESQIQHAAAIALDRMAERSPLEMLNYLNTHPTELAGRPMLRADYFAKADLAQPSQRSAIEVYLGRPDVTLAEKTKALQALATPASFASETLLTDAPPADDGTARQASLGSTVADWLEKNRFPDLRAPLERLGERLR